MFFFFYNIYVNFRLVTVLVAFCRENSKTGLSTINNTKCGTQINSLSHKKQTQKFEEIELLKI